MQRYTQRDTVIEREKEREKEKERQRAQLITEQKEKQRKRVKLVVSYLVLGEDLCVRCRGVGSIV